MKKYKASRERERQESIVRPHIEIKDPSAELFSQSRPWEFDDPLQDSFLEAPEVETIPKDYHRVPKLKFRTSAEAPIGSNPAPKSHETRSQSLIVESRQYNATDSGVSSVEVSPMPMDIPSSKQPQLVASEVVAEPEPIPIRPAHDQPTSRRQPERINIKTTRSRSLPPSPSMAFSPPKASFQLFRAQCAPSPTSASPIATTPIFELSADEATFSLNNVREPDTPIELDAGPLPDPSVLYPPPLNLHHGGSNKSASDGEPEASPFNRLTALAKSSIHGIHASLSTIAETEEDALSRRSSAHIYELPTAQISPKTISSYMGGTSITPRGTYYNATARQSEPETLPTRATSTRSSASTKSNTNSMHSIFSFEYSNSDTEKIYVAEPIRRESSAPSLTDISSVDDFDLDFDLDLDLELDPRRSRSISKRDAKLERYFGIRQYSIGTESESVQGNESPISPKPAVAPAPAPAIIQALNKEIAVHRRSSSLGSVPGYGHRRSSSSMLEDIDYNIAMELDPEKKDMMSMKRSILNKSRSKQDAKLEKFFGCGKDQIQVARKFSTGSRLAGCTDDLQYRTIGWEYGGKM